MTRARLVALALVVAGCTRAEPPVPAESAPKAMAPVEGDAAARSALLVPEGDARRRRDDVVPKVHRPTCRVLALDGQATEAATERDGGVSVATGAPLGPEWVTLAAGARLTVKHPRTGRETVYAGPGKVRPCTDDAEEAWVARGVFTSSPGEGESPGGEQWVVTPFGVVRYGAAKVEVRVDADGATVRLASGRAEAWASGGDDDAWRPIGAEPRPLAPPHAGAVGARAAIDRCASATRASAAIGAAIDAASGPGGDAGALADLAPKDIAARYLAHAACAVARLDVSLLSPKESAEASPRLRRAEERDAR